VRIRRADPCTSEYNGFSVLRETAIWQKGGWEPTICSHAVGDISR
jgi:hypothetical protein